MTFGGDTAEKPATTELLQLLRASDSSNADTWCKSTNETTAAVHRHRVPDHDAYELTRQCVQPQCPEELAHLVLCALNKMARRHCQAQQPPDADMTRRQLESCQPVEFHVATAAGQHMPPYASAAIRDAPL